MYKYELKRRNSSLVIKTAYADTPDLNPWEKQLKNWEYRGLGLGPDNYEILVFATHDVSQSCDCPCKKQKKKKSTKKLEQAKTIQGMKKALLELLKDA